MNNFNDLTSSSFDNSVHMHYQRLKNFFDKAGDSADDKAGDSADIVVHGPGVCLAPLLDALGWRGENRHIMEALPHFETVEDITTLRSILARLNFDTREEKLSLSNILPGMLPCLFSENGKDVHVILERNDDKLTIFNSISQQEEERLADDADGIFYFISQVDSKENDEYIKKHGWMSMLLRKFKKIIYQLLGISLLSNLIALALPIYIMNVYDKVIGSDVSGIETLGYFFLGILALFAVDMGLRYVRSRMLAYLGTRCEVLVSSLTFQQILHMPVGMTEKAPLASQLTRIKQFEGLREMFTGSIATAILDLPFIILFLGTIILLGGHIAWVPIGLLIIFALIAMFSIPRTKYHVAMTGDAQVKLRNFLIEMISNHKAIKDNNAEEVWVKRYQEVAGKANLYHFHSQHFNQILQTVDQGMVMIAGVATLWIGSYLVMDGSMTVGTLIAVMAMVWRLLSPLQAAFLSLNRLSQVMSTFRQVNQLMSFTAEKVPGDLPSFYRQFKGEVSFFRTGMRYSPRSEPALIGTNVDIPAGQFVAVTGPNGAGKSTVLKLIAALYRPQTGAVLVDGLDLRQIDVAELRHAIGYVPQEIQLFHGNIDQNLRLAHPAATDEDIEKALAEARVWDCISILPDGRDTILTTEMQAELPDGLKQRLILARAYVKGTPPIFLFDEPANNLDKSGDQGLMRKLQSLKGKSTIIMVTHRPSHIQIADRVLYMDKGQIIHDGTPEQILPLVMQAA